MIECCASQTICSEESLLCFIFNLWISTFVKDNKNTVAMPNCYKFLNAYSHFLNVYLTMPQQWEITEWQTLRGSGRVDTWHSSWLPSISTLFIGLRNFLKRQSSPSILEAEEVSYLHFQNFYANKCGHIMSVNARS